MNANGLTTIYLNSYMPERPSYPTANVRPNIACARPFSKNTLSVLYAKDMNHYSMILCAALALLWYESRRMSVTNQLVDASCKNLISMKFFWCLNRTKSLQDPSNLSDSRLNDPNDSVQLTRALQTSKILKYTRGGHSQQTPACVHAQGASA